jgi:hypothetical protein
MSWRDHFSRSPRATRKRIDNVKWLLKTPFVYLRGFVSLISVWVGGFIDGAGGVTSLGGGVVFVISSAVLGFLSFVVLVVLGVATNDLWLAPSFLLGAAQTAGMIFYSRSFDDGGEAA